jgi:hypothetical protein
MADIYYKVAAFPAPLPNGLASHDHSPQRERRNSELRSSTTIAMT